MASQCPILFHWWFQSDHFQLSPFSQICPPFQHVSCSPCFWRSCNSLARTKIGKKWQGQKYYPLFSNPHCSLQSLLLQFIPCFSHTTWSILDSSCLLGFCILLTWQPDTRIITNIFLRLTHSCTFLSPTARLTSISLAVLVPTQPFPDTTPLHTLSRCQEYFLPIVEPAALCSSLWGRKPEKQYTLMSLYFCCFLFLLFPFPGFHSYFPTESYPASLCLHTLMFSATCCLNLTQKLLLSPRCVPYKNSNNTPALKQLKATGNCHMNSGKSVHLHTWTAPCMLWVSIKIVRMESKGNK